VIWTSAELLEPVALIVRYADWGRLTLLPENVYEFPFGRWYTHVEFATNAANSAPPVTSIVLFPLRNVTFVTELANQNA
jgi:hypothetical protein